MENKREDRVVDRLRGEEEAPAENIILSGLQFAAEAAAADMLVQGIKNAGSVLAGTAAGAAALGGLKAAGAAAAASLPAIATVGGIVAGAGALLYADIYKNVNAAEADMNRINSETQKAALAKAEENEQRIQSLGEMDAKIEEIWKEYDSNSEDKGNEIPPYEGNKAIFDFIKNYGNMGGAITEIRDEAGNVTGYALDEEKKDRYLQEEIFKSNSETLRTLAEIFGKGEVDAQEVRERMEGVVEQEHEDARNNRRIRDAAEEVRREFFLSNIADWADNYTEEQQEAIKEYAQKMLDGEIPGVIANMPDGGDVMLEALWEAAGQKYVEYLENNPQETHGMDIVDEEGLKKTTEFAEYMAERYQYYSGLFAQYDGTKSLKELTQEGVEVSGTAQSEQQTSQPEESQAPPKASEAPAPTATPEATPTPTTTATPAPSPTAAPPKAKESPSPEETPAPEASVPTPPNERVPSSFLLETKEELMAILNRPDVKARMMTAGEKLDEENLIVLRPEKSDLLDEESFQSGMDGLREEMDGGHDALLEQLGSIERQLNALAAQIAQAKGEILRRIGKAEDGGQANAEGTNNFPGGMTKINERGDELIELPEGTKIYPAHETGRRMQSASPVNVDMDVHIAQLVVREDADLDRIARQLYEKLCFYQKIMP